MSKEISLTITKILNWTSTDHNVLLEIAFYASKSRAYLAHKTALGSYSGEALLLNTSFKIQYSPEEHILICKIASVQKEQDSQDEGTIQVDLTLLEQRPLIFIPFQDHDKVLELKVYKAKDPAQSHNHQADLRQKRQRFLHQRYEFLQKISGHQAELKKRFSEKVYSFLRELKARGGNEGEQQETAEVRRPGEFDFRSRFNEDKRRGQVKRPDLLNSGGLSSKDSYRYPGQRAQQELLVHSMQTKNEDIPGSKKGKAFGGLLEHAEY